MPLLHILRYPDSRLRLISTPVEEVDDEIRQLLDDMLETMYAAPGIGLAAPQVDVTKRIITIDVSPKGDAPVCLINPEIISHDGKEMMEEGCLSVPGVHENVERAGQIRVKALDRDGTSIELEAEGLLSVCIQHETDHLDGKLFVDYLSEIKRKRIQKKMEKQRRFSM
ncbi:Peptide deformylase [hydrothermal vent metagenome]|uniref:Peptide deformylase n=1 Tax=hydrothermal vent metagenome TaxID=652676 RepID=A0A3B0Z5W2_9ZZZZ